MNDKTKYRSISLLPIVSSQEFNKLTGDNFAARLKQANLASKNGTAYQGKLKNCNKIITSNKTKHVLIHSK